MGYPKEVYDKAWETLSRRKDGMRESARLRREEVHRKIPEAARIDQELAETAAGVAKAILGDPNSAGRRIETLRRHSLTLQERRETLLRAHGFPADYMAERPVCPLCGDSGFVDGRMCTCFQRLLKESASGRLSSAAPASLCSFDTFSVQYYPDSPVDDSGVVPRVRMAQVRDYCSRYAGQFDPRAAESVLMLGQTGLGKTHLSLSIAQAVTEAGFGVVYTPVQKLVHRLEAEKFSRSQEGREQYSETLEGVLTCDLLILDDLGTEFHTQFSSSMLYNVVNSRLVENRATIVSTNLTLPQIEEKYSQRMVSRLVCSYRVLRFYGRDIRYLKKQEQ